jgi:hypothetical protein
MDPLIDSDSIRMIVTSMTRKGEQSLTELEVERFLNALTRAQSGVATGISQFAHKILP